jgi:hypothetical protein
MKLGFEEKLYFLFYSILLNPVKCVIHLKLIYFK